MTIPILYNYFTFKTKELLALHKLTATLKASDNIGKNRENFINFFLSVVLPPKLSVRSGEIWDSKGDKTGQIDTIVTRDDAPSLDFGGENAYLVEGVFAVIEIKSNLTVGKKSKLSEAIRTMKKVEKLHLESPGLTFGTVLGRPLRLLFAYEGATFPSIIAELKEASAEDTFDLICILKKGCFVKKGLLIILKDKETGEESSDEIVFKSEASALGLLYLYLIQYGSSFSTGGVHLDQYFAPFTDWA